MYQVDESDNLNHAEVLNIDTNAMLTEQEIADLQFMREEEKLARDVYSTLYTIWGQQIFSNIAKSEQKHTDSIATLLEAYELSDPFIDEVGKYTDPNLTGLYTDLVSQGSESIESALRV